MRQIHDLLVDLIRTPSQVAIDDSAQIVKKVTAWLDEQHVSYLIAGPTRRPSAIVINPPKHEADEVLLLNACLDTAPVGDLAQWHHSPFAGAESNGWLYGRGSADCKAAVAIFAQLAKRERLISKAGKRLRRISIIFDCDEHSGRFGGIRAYTRRFGFPRYCAIGYPGIDRIICGSRGFYRSVVTLRGSLGHAGSGTVPNELATDKLQRILLALSEFSTFQSTEDSGDFPLRPRASVTWINSGVRSFSVTPSKIECGVDLRLTPTFDPSAALTFLEDTLDRIAKDCGNKYPSILSKPNCWPAFRTPQSALLPRLLGDAAKGILGQTPEMAISGPSNIGNFLAMHGTEVVAGFGVEYRNVHGPDECVRIATIDDVYGVYSQVIGAFMTMPYDG